MATCDKQGALSDAAKQQHEEVHPEPSFHPLDECSQNLSLQEIIELSDDFLFHDGLLNEEEADILNPMIQSSACFPSPITVNHVEAIQPTKSEVVVPNCVSDPLCRIVSEGSLGSNLSPGSSYQSSKKKRPISSSEISLENNTEKTNTSTIGDVNRFRPYQEVQWSEHFYDLCEYRQETGNCRVPHAYRANPRLARWVKRQRYQYKLMMEGKPSSLTYERVKVLENIGFVWDSQGTAWAERFRELCEFLRINGHTNVPGTYAGNRRLAIWVKRQRRQYKLFQEGKHSMMTTERISRLEGINFEWLSPRNAKRSNGADKTPSVP